MTPIPPEVYDLYIGQMLAGISPTAEEISYTPKGHFHSQCTCEACNWADDNEKQYRTLVDKPITFDIIIIKNIHKINVSAKTYPWQYCVEKCHKQEHLIQECQFTIPTKDLIHLWLSDIKHVSQILNTFTFNGRKLYAIGGGNVMEVTISIEEEVLDMDIITTSDDGSIECECYGR